MPSQKLPVLVITGPVGVGKTTVAAALSELLGQANLAHALIDLDWLRWCYPSPTDDPFHLELGIQNLAAVWSHYIWGQNILVDADGNVTGLVDFDQALWGDVEIEFAVLDYCGISKPAFWEGYGQPRDESASAEIRRLFYLFYEVQKYMPIHIWRRNDPTGAARYKQHSLALAAQLGLG